MKLQRDADDLARTVTALKELGTPYTETEVLQTELRNQPGALAHICEQMAAELLGSKVKGTVVNGNGVCVVAIADQCSLATRP